MTINPLPSQPPAEPDATAQVRPRSLRALVIASLTDERLMLVALTILLLGLAALGTMFGFEAAPVDAPDPAELIAGDLPSVLV